MLVLNHETGLSLPKAPEFEADGSWPPLATAWVVERIELFTTKYTDPGSAAACAVLNPNSLRRSDGGPTKDVLSGEFLYKELLGRFSDSEELWFARMSGWREIKCIYLCPPTKYFKAQPGSRVATLDDNCIEAFTPPFYELRRLVHSVRWRRSDPVTQLPPGATDELMYSITTGLSVERSRTLANSLGVSIGADAAHIQASLNHQVMEEFGLSIEITAQEQRSNKLTLPNSRPDRYGLFALWHVDHRIDVDALTVGDVPEPKYKAQPLRLSVITPAWEHRGSTEFAVGDQPHVTHK
jgi:hypothetical protein